MSIDLTLVKKLREQTGIGILECKTALSQADNDLEKAIEILRKKGFEKAKKKSSRETKQGIISSYIHSNNKIGVLLELSCETDFVAKNVEYIQLGKDICMQIAAMDPNYISENDIPKEELEKEKEIYRDQMKNSGKPENIIEKIVEGKLKKFYTESCLIQQKFFKNDKQTINDLLVEKIHKIGENIVIKRFVRYQIG